MLVLSRKVGEAIRLADDIEITVLAVDNLRVRLGIRAPQHINVRRTELEVDMVETNRQAAVHAAPDVDQVLSKAASAKSKQG
jgi:carbon storage regulator